MKIQEEACDIELLNQQVPEGCVPTGPELWMHEVEGDVHFCVLQNEYVSKLETSEKKYRKSLDIHGLSY